MSRFALRQGVFLFATLCCAACVSQHHLQSRALDFLYPEGSPAVAPSDVRLQLPVRVGVAFAPATTPRREAFSEAQKQVLLERVADAFRGRKTIGRVDVIPGSYLRPGGGFENLGKLAPAFGIDLVALIAYDQFQVSESGRSSWAYWTLIGAYIVKGERSETRTVLEAVVIDIPSRAMLFHAGGTSHATGRATPIDVHKSLRRASERGFDRAADDLITNLDESLDAFAKQSRSGTVRGPGTPAISVVDEAGRPVKGGGALGGVELLLAALFLLAAPWRRTA